MRFIMRRFRFTSFHLIILASLYITITSNLGFFSSTLNVYPFAENAAFVVSLAITLLAAIVLFISFFSILLSVRVATTIFLLVAATSSYFVDQFGTIIDDDMIRNTMETNVSEAGDLLSIGFVLRVFLLAVIPVIILWLLPYEKKNAIKDKSMILGLGTSALAIMLLMVFVFSEHYASFFREHKQLRYYTNPTYPIFSAGKYAVGLVKGKQLDDYVRLTEEADIPENDIEKELVIIVVGETARAGNFSLNGYERKTNPLLEKEKSLVSYDNFTSCGTSTTISVPCMFSFSDRKSFDVNRSRQTQNVLDVLALAGVSILWRDNNSDSKGVAERLNYQSFRAPETNTICDPECRDVGMLVGLQEYIDRQEKDVLIVLHQMGSHGPAYYKRYPKSFEKFKPVCESNELSECTRDEIVNAYDNTILYTDYFLSEVIKLLKSNDQKYETSMLYISDHGESLGENGLYLHGMPYFMAPKEQVSVPFIAWIGGSSDLDYGEIEKIASIENNHDAFAQAILAAFEVKTDLVTGDDTELLKSKNQHDY